MWKAVKTKARKIRVGKVKRRREGRKKNKKKVNKRKKKTRKKKPKKKQMMEMKKVAEEWEIWDKEEEAAKSEVEAKKLVSERFHKWIYVFGKKASERIPTRKL